METTDAWWTSHRGHISEDSSPFELALLGGSRSDRLAWAFASGYHAALCRLIGGPLDRLRSLSVTEAGGTSPKSMETRFDNGRLHGQKVFSTFGSSADEILVLAVASQGTDGRKDLVLVRTNARAEEIERTNLDTPFVPEIGHATVTFSGARGERIAGDGWTDFVRPFRTIEDCFVQTAVIGYLLSLSLRFAWSAEYQERLATLALALHSTASLDPDSAPAQLALSTTTNELTTLVEMFTQELPENDERARLVRDRPLLRVASKAREVRLSLARDELGLERRAQ